MIKPGHFEGIAYHDWIERGRRFRLVESMTFVDQRGFRWHVPRWFEVDRSHVPGFLQRWVADPFCRKMRRATAVHCFYSWHRSFHSSRVHRMYAEAMVTDGVPMRQWVPVYWGLVLFGEQW